ncbi:DUF1659 domain-containing protein [Fodinisporobacter ferrooxydans]|uniref:DUF1659 domain-containing protein n=1 Tax=Fodinisporobacter ferrooxydans TaxID=2901836 RepID=A0ABY4CPI8_9BACL|nr:DUF1659 domain-containing protein [Alicyclobacillaceae bacterium MYW30-H2]
MIASNIDTTHLVIRIIAGTTVDGKAIYKNRTYNNIKVSATDDDVYAVGQAMASLQADQVAAVERINTNKLSDNNASVSV